jgi:hypothetical protein
MAKINFAEVVEQICGKDDRFSSDAYHFVQEGLNHTLKSLKRGGQHAHRPVSVLNEWGVSTTDDFGQVVFNLVNSGVLGKNETDSPNDFKNVFTFDEAFVKPFAPRLAAPVRKRASAKAKKRTSKSKKAGSLE